MLCNEGPLLRPVLIDKFDEENIFVLGPGLLFPCLAIIDTFDRIRVIGIDFLPPGDAIDVLPTRKVARNILPVHLL